MPQEPGVIQVQAFKDGDVRFLICTDVAARGIDIQGLPYMVNMTLPDRSFINRFWGKNTQKLVTEKHFFDVSSFQTTTVELQWTVLPASCTTD